MLFSLLSLFYGFSLLQTHLASSSINLYVGFLLVCSVLFAILAAVLWQKLQKKSKELEFRTGIMESANRMLGEMLDERRRNEETLRESQERYRLLVENQSDMIVKVDNKGRFLFVSPSYCRMFGKTQEELLGQAFMPMVHPDDQQSTEEAMQQLYSPPHTCRLEQRAMTASGWRWLAWTDTAVLNSKREVVAIIGVGRDITAQKEAELALRDSERRWLLALEGSGDGVWDWNLETNEVFYSKHWSLMLGYDAWEVENTYDAWAQLVHPADLQNAQKRIQDHLEGKTESYMAEYRMMARDGSWKWMLDRGKIMDQGPQGKPIRMVGAHTDITHIKRMQEEMQKQNVFISTILRNLPIGVAVNYADNGKAIYMNEAFSNIYGWPAEIIQDVEKFFEVVYPDQHYRSRIRNRIMEDIASANPKRMRWDEVEITTQSGQKRFVNALNIPLPDQNLMVSTVRDVTHKVLDRQNLKQQQEMLRYIVLHDPNAIAVLDNDLNFLFVSNRFLADYGLQDHDLVGRHHYEVFPDIPEKWRRVHQRALQGEIISAEEDVFRRSNGRIDYTRWECRPWYKDDATIGGIVLYTEVITKRKLQEIELQRQRDQLQLMLDITQTMAVSVTYEEGLLHTLKQVCENTPWEIGEVWELNPLTEKLELSSVWHASHPGLSGFREESLKYTFAPGEGLPGIAFKLCKPCWMHGIQENDQFVRAGEARQYKLQTGVGIPVSVGKEVVNVMVFFSREVVPEDEEYVKVFSGTGLQLGELFRLKQAERQTQILNSELEHRVRVRTAQLEAANRELEAFSYSVSHDLRAPLRAITGFARILSEEHSNTLDAEALRLLAIVAENATSMDKLITDLLAFSRVGKGDMNKTTVDMHTLAAKVFEEVAGEARLQIKFILKDLPPAMADPDLMLQLWRNLISNAVKYSAKEINPVIEVGVASTPGEHMYFVKDNGVGFDPKYQEKIFQIFQRLHRQDEFEGTGVGLAIAQRIILKHDGRIWVETQPGRGACFWFAIPANS